MKLEGNWGGGGGTFLYYSDYFYRTFMDYSSGMSWGIGVAWDERIVGDGSKETGFSYEIFVEGFTGLMETWGAGCFCICENICGAVIGNEKDSDPNFGVLLVLIYGGGKGLWGLFSMKLRGLYWVFETVIL